MSLQNVEHQLIANLPSLIIWKTSQHLHYCYTAYVYTLPNGVSACSYKLGNFQNVCPEKAIQVKFVDRSGIHPVVGPQCLKTCLKIFNTKM